MRTRVPVVDQPEQEPAVSGRWSTEQLADAVVRRARQVSLRSDDQTLLLMGKDLRKQLLSAIDEVQRLWKQGKPVQRRVQLVLAPLMWQAQSGIDPRDMDVGSATEGEELIQPGFTPQWDAFTNVAAHALLGSRRIHGRQLRDEEFTVAMLLPLNSMYIYMAARRFGTPSVFELRDGLAEKLLLTDTGSILAGDVQTPLPGFYIQMPVGALELRNRSTGWHRATVVGVAEAYIHRGPRAGRSLQSIFWCEPNEKSQDATDDNAQMSFISLSDDAMPVEEIESSLDWSVIGRQMEKQPFVRWQGKELSFEDGYRLLRAFVINFCLYLSSPHPDIQPTGSKQTWSDVVDRAEIARETGPRAKQPVTIGKNFALWDVGRNVTKIQRQMTAVDILVRGHWRKQVHGPKRSLRRVIWIEPFVRRRTGEEVEGRSYDVGRGDVEKNPMGSELAALLYARLYPILGEPLAKHTSNNVASAIDDEYRNVPEATHQVLVQAMKLNGRYDFLTGDMIREAVLAVEDIEP